MQTKVSSHLKPGWLGTRYTDFQGNWIEAKTYNTHNIDEVLSTIQYDILFYVEGTNGNNIAITSYEAINGDYILYPTVDDIWPLIYDEETGARYGVSAYIEIWNVVLPLDYCFDGGSYREFCFSAKIGNDVFEFGGISDYNPMFWIDSFYVGNGGGLRSLKSPSLTKSTPDPLVVFVIKNMFYLEYGQYNAKVYSYDGQTEYTDYADVIDLYVANGEIIEGTTAGMYIEEADEFVIIEPDDFGDWEEELTQ